MEQKDSAGLTGLEKVQRRDDREPETTTAGRDGPVFAVKNVQGSDDRETGPDQDSDLSCRDENAPFDAVTALRPALHRSTTLLLRSSRFR